MDFDDSDFEPDDGLDRDGDDREPDDFDWLRGAGLGEAFWRWDDDPDDPAARFGAGRDDPWLPAEGLASRRSLPPRCGDDARFDDGVCSVFLGSAIRR